jgi:hypothetical protein
MQQGIGQGGFSFPTVYQEDLKKVTTLLQQGEVSLVEVSRLTLADQFMAFIIQTEFLNFADKTYPNPRKKNEIPVWFLISCQFVLRLHPDVKYSALETLLKSGPVLSRIGFNVSAPLGFNEKNKYPRDTPIHHDSVRKFFKDTNRKAIKSWFGGDLQKWFRRMECFDQEGVFILDQTHLVVPDNEHYEDAVKMPVDEHGQLYKNLGELSPEQKKALKYHPCYTLSTLLHLSHKHQAFHIAGYEFGPGNEDELPQAKQIIISFFKHHKPGTIKLLIADRGYLSGEFISWLKTQYEIDVLIPLRHNMDICQDAIAISQMKDTKWTTLPPIINSQEHKTLRACTIDNIKLWDECSIPLFVTVVEVTETDELEGVSKKTFCLCSTKKFDSPEKVLNSYKLRVKTEECFRQFKNNWYINKFPSPHHSLLEAHISFTLLTYSLLQLFLLRTDLQRKTNKFLSTIQREELNSTTNLLVYADNSFSRFSLKEYSILINELNDEVRDKFKQNLNSAIHQH